MVKRMVKPHSSARSWGPHWARAEATLSSMTTITLATMASRSRRSNARPAGVSASKITSWSLARSSPGVRLMLGRRGTLLLGFGHQGAGPLVGLAHDARRLRVRFLAQPVGRDVRADLRQGAVRPRHQRVG